MRASSGLTRAGDGVTIVRGEEELVRRIGHRFTTVTELSCVASDLRTWMSERKSAETIAAMARRAGEVRLRKIYRSGLLLDTVSAREVAGIRDRMGAQVRVTTEDVNETIVMDGRLVILAGNLNAGQRSYSVITQPETVEGVMSLFETAWRSATDLDVFDARVSEIRRLAPAVLDLLSRGVKDESAARTLGMGARTYRRRVAELMSALGADSRFQAGVRARELGLVS
ncbi:MAG: DNA-binding response regulator [Stackebrandtia sp.]